MNEIFGTYAFADVHAVLIGPGGAIILGDGSGAADEGITIEPIGERNAMTIGADGSGMHALMASRAAHIRVRLLQTSPVNGQLQQMMNYQSSSSLFHGKNLFNISNPILGDNISASGAAFAKQPGIVMGKEGSMREWEFDAIYTSTVLGGTVDIPLEAV